MATRQSKFQILSDKLIVHLSDVACLKYNCLGKTEFLDGKASSDALGLLISYNIFYSGWLKLNISNPSNNSYHSAALFEGFYP